MAISAQGRQRLREVARNLTKLVEDEKQEPGRDFTFAELEDDSIEVTDLLAQMLVEEQLAKKFSAAEPSVCCPNCQQEIARDADEPRVLQTDRGEVTWTEPSYACLRPDHPHEKAASDDELQHESRPRRVDRKLWCERFGS